MEKERALRRGKEVYDVTNVIVKQRNDERFRDVYGALQLLDADPMNHSLLFSTKVTKSFLNSAKTMHGGAIMFIGDYLMHIARLTYQKDNRGGLSVNMCTEFLRPAELGEHIRIQVKVIKYWEEMSLANMEMTKESTGEIIATASLTMMGKPVYFNIKSKI